MLWKNHRDQWSLIALILILGLFALNGRLGLDLPGEVIGGLMAILTLVAQFYFRKAGGGE